MSLQNFMQSMRKVYAILVEHSLHEMDTFVWLNGRQLLQNREKGV